MFWIKCSPVCRVAGSRKSGLPINANTHAYHTYTLTYADDSPIEYANDITMPKSGAARNPYTDLFGPVFSALIREGADYKLTVNSYLMTSTGQARKAVYEYEFTSPSFSGTRKWWDKTNGNDANDGNDPWGFDCTNATYTEATGELTQTGFFASYDHTEATAADYQTNNFNYVYVDGFGT